MVSGTSMLYAMISTSMMSSRMKVMLVNLPLVNVMKWAISGAVFTIRMPPSSCICRGWRTMKMMQAADNMINVS